MRRDLIMPGDRRSQRGARRLQRHARQASGCHAHTADVANVIACSHINQNIPPASGANPLRGPVQRRTRCTDTTRRPWMQNQSRGLQKLRQPRRGTAGRHAASRAHKPPRASSGCTPAPVRAANGSRCSAGWPVSYQVVSQDPVRLREQPTVTSPAKRELTPCRRGRLARARVGGIFRFFFRHSYGGAVGRARRAHPPRPLPVPGAHRTGAGRPAACRGSGPARCARDCRVVPAPQGRRGARGAGQRGQPVHRLLDQGPGTWASMPPQRRAAVARAIPGVRRQWSAISPRRRRCQPIRSRWAAHAVPDSQPVPGIRPGAVGLAAHPAPARRDHGRVRVRATWRPSPIPTRSTRPSRRTSPRSGDPRPSTA